MAMVTVIGRVPVYVVVDTDAGTVERVVVNDESWQVLDAAAPRDYNSDEPILDVTLAARAEAIVTDPAVMWPSWEFGW